VEAHLSHLAATMALTRHGWALPVLAAMAGGVALKPGPLARALPGASRPALEAGVAHLIDLELIRLNPGHGHPLRPAFTVTPAGQAMAARAHRLWAEAVRQGEAARRFVRLRWGLPLLLALHEARSQPTGFADLRRALGTITDRALALILKEAVAAGLVARVVDPAAHPPAVGYVPLDSAARLCDAFSLEGRSPA
jgi:DNA-binding HxlR family transcriptional regulator